MLKSLARKVIFLYLQTYLQATQHTYLTYLQANQPTYLQANQTTNLPTYKPTNQPTYQPTNLPYQPTYLLWRNGKQSKSDLWVGRSKHRVDSSQNT